MTVPRLLTLVDLCLYLGVSKASFYRKVAPAYAGQFQVLSLAGLARYDRRDWDRIIAKVKAEGGDNPFDGRKSANKKAREVSHAADRGQHQRTAGLHHPCFGPSA